MTGNSAPSPRPVKRWVMRALVIATIVSVMLAFAKRIEDLSYETYLQALRMNTSVELNAARDVIQPQLASRIRDTVSLADALRQNPDMSQAEFDDRAGDLLLHNNDVLAVAAAPDLVVTMVSPIAGNEGVLGLNYRERPDQLDKVTKAIRTGTGQIAGPVDLVQGGRGIILRHPVTVVRDTGEAENWGIVSAVLDYEAFVNKLQLPALQDRYDFVLREKPEDDGATAQILMGDTKALALNPVVLGLNIPFGNWEIAATPLGGWPLQRPEHMRHWLIRLAFIAIIAASLAYVMRISDKHRKAENRLTNGIEALHHGFVMFDPDGKLVAMNKRYSEMHGPSSVVRMGITYAEIVKSSLAKGLIRDAIGREEDWFEEWKNTPRDGTADAEQVLPDGRIMQTSDRLMEDGSIVGLRIDVTDLKMAQQAAEAANKAKTDFMGVLSHELRTPLTVILGHARLAQHFDRLPPALGFRAALEAYPEAEKDVVPKMDALLNQVTNMMARLERSGEHLLSLINEILDYAKIDSGSLSIKPSENTIADIVAPIEDQLRPMIEQKGLEFNVDAQDGTICADAARIRQVLINLLGNASKFTETGAIGLNVTLTDDHAEFRVTDTGMGIPEDEVSRVFEAFHQVDASPTRQFGGTGLGLAISRDIAQAHGGTLTASSKIGRGSVFVLSLPISLPETPEQDIESPQDLVA